MSTLLSQEDLSASFRIPSMQRENGLLSAPSSPPSDLWGGKKKEKKSGEWTGCTAVPLFSALKVKIVVRVCTVHALRRSLVAGRPRPVSYGQAQVYHGGNRDGQCHQVDKQPSLRVRFT